MTRLLARFCALPLALLGALGGCRLVDIETYEKSLGQLHRLRDENRKLTQTNHDLRARLAEAEKQIAVLRSLPPDRLDKLYHVARLSLGRYTGGVDLDGKPGDDAVRVLLQPTDREGDTIKAAGEAVVQLFDLAEADDKRLIGEYRWGLDELAKTWAGGFLSYHFLLDCPWKSGPPKHDEITVRAEFTDYLLGRKFTAQKLCKIDLPRAATSAPTTRKP